MIRMLYLFLCFFLGDSFRLYSVNTNVVADPVSHLVVNPHSDNDQVMVHDLVGSDHSDSEVDSHEEDLAHEVELTQIAVEYCSADLAAQQKQYLLEAQQNNFDNVIAYLEWINNSLTAIENNFEDVHAFDNMHFSLGCLLLWRTYAGCSLFMQAVIYNRLDVIDAIFHLVNRLYSVNVSVRQLMHIIFSTRDNNGDTPLSYAAKHNKEVIIRQIVTFLEAYFYNIADYDFTRELLQASSFLRDNDTAQPALLYLVEQGSEGAVRDIIMFLVRLEENELLDLHDIVILIDESEVNGYNLLGLIHRLGYDDIATLFYDHILGYFILDLAKNNQGARARSFLKIACQWYLLGRKTSQWLYDVLRTYDTRMDSALMVAVRNNDQDLVEDILSALQVVTSENPASNAFVHQVFDRNNNDRQSVALLVAQGGNDQMINLFDLYTQFVCHQTFREAASQEVRALLDSGQAPVSNQVPQLVVPQHPEVLPTGQDFTVEATIEENQDLGDNWLDDLTYVSDSEIDIEEFFSQV